MAELDTNIVTEGTENLEPETEVTENANSLELEKLKAELAKQKAALDKATKEAAESKRALRAKQSAEEVKAEEEAERWAAIEKERDELLKEKTIATSSKKIMAFVGDETVANDIAEYLYGAEDVESAIGEIQKAWTAKEKALRLEYGKIPAPGVGNSEGSTVTKAELDAMTYTERIEFARKYPDDYERLMGRK